jgi:hypothetical protein
MAANDRPLVTRGGHEHGNTAQSGGLALMTGVGPQHTPATRLWFGKASNAPGFRSLPHHHGEAETGAYLLSSRARIYFGQGLSGLRRDVGRRFHVRSAVLAASRSQHEHDRRTRWLACRTPENIVVNLPDVADASLAGYRRARS